MKPNLVAPVTAADIAGTEWLAERRAVIVRDGYALRASPLVALPKKKPEDPEVVADPLAIEIKSLRDNTWLLLALPNQAPRFASVADRDAVLWELVGGKL